VTYLNWEQANLTITKNSCSFWIKERLSFSKALLALWLMAYIPFSILCGAKRCERAKASYALHGGLGGERHLRLTEVEFQV